LKYALTRVNIPVLYRWGDDEDDDDDDDDVLPFSPVHLAADDAADWLPANGHVLLWRVGVQSQWSIWRLASNATRKRANRYTLCCNIALAMFSSATAMLSESSVAFGRVCVSVCLSVRAKTVKTQIQVYCTSSQKAKKI